MSVEKYFHHESWQISLESHLIDKSHVVHDLMDDFHLITTFVMRCKLVKMINKSSTYNHLVEPFSEKERKKSCSRSSVRSQQSFSNIF